MRESLNGGEKHAFCWAFLSQHHSCFILFGHQMICQVVGTLSLQCLLTGSPVSRQICVVIAAVFGIVIYRVVTVSTFAAFKWALIRNNSQVATTGTAVCINFCIIMLLNVVRAPQGSRPSASRTWAAAGSLLLLLKAPGFRQSCSKAPGTR